MYYRNVLDRLRSSGFKTTTAVQHRRYTFAHVAKRTAFEAWKYGFVETFFVLAEFDSLDHDTMRNYSKACWSYALRRTRVPLPRGFGHSMECFSVATTCGLDDAVGQMVRNTEPPRHWAAAEIPVIVDLETGQLYYLERTPDWGSLYWDGRRETIVKYLSPRQEERS